VRHHHERMDGKGYPDGLAGVKIPLGARIIAVADTFDAITSSRSYRSAGQAQDRSGALRKAAGTQLDRDIVHAFLAYYSGKRSLARWAVLLTGPYRWFGELAGWFQGAAAAGLKGSATAVLLTGSVFAVAAAAPAIADYLPKRESVSAAELASARRAEDKVPPGQEKGLPPGLAKKDQLPPGLRKKDELPPGLAKQVSGSKKAHPPRANGNKNKKDASAVTAGDESSGQGNSKTTAEDASSGQGDSATTAADASSGQGSGMKPSKK
jgi:hypothetical protein